MDASTAVEFRADDSGKIILHLNGQPKLSFGQPDVSGVRAKKTRTAILAALDQAMQDGARHGVCDRLRESALSLADRPLPEGCMHYQLTGDNPGGWAVAQRNSGGEPEVIVTGARPFYVGSMVVNALDRAFKIGGRFGHPAVDGIARPFVTATGAVLTAVAVDRDVKLRSWPKVGYTVASEAYGTQVTVRCEVDGLASAFVVFDRYDGPSRTPEGTEISPGDPGAGWTYRSVEMTAQELAEWDREPIPGTAYPSPQVSAWLGAVAELKTAQPFDPATPEG